MVYEFQSLSLIEELHGNPGKDDYLRNSHQAISSKPSGAKGKVDKFRQKNKFSLLSQTFDLASTNTMHGGARTCSNIVNPTVSLAGSLVASPSTPQKYCQRAHDEPRFLSLTVSILTVEMHHMEKRSLAFSFPDTAKDGPPTKKMSPFDCSSGSYLLRKLSDDLAESGEDDMEIDPPQPRARERDALIKVRAGNAL